MPGNICVDSTAVVNTERPRKRQRETPYAAKIAMITLATLAMVETKKLFAKYCASGTVVQMSMNGWMVNVVGHQVQVLCTSASGFTDDVIIT